MVRALLTSRTAFAPRSDRVASGELRRSRAVFIVASPFGFLPTRTSNARWLNMRSHSNLGLKPLGNAIFVCLHPDACSLGRLSSGRREDSACRVEERRT